MAKAYVVTRYTDAKGTHKVGEQVQLPRDTDEQKAGFDRLVNTGVLSTTKVAKKASES